MKEEGSSVGPVPIFMNSRAGMGGDAEAELAGEADALGLSVDIRPVEPARLAAELKRAVVEGHPVIGVAGGDGTLRTAANVLCGTETILAPIPAGTLNRFCRRLGLFSKNQAMYWLSQGAVERVPLGIVDGDLFMNSAVFGAYSDIVRRRERLRPVLTKWVAAAVSTAVFMVRAPLLDVTIDLGGAGGERIARVTPMLWIGMGGGSFPFVHDAPRPSGPDLLEVAIVRARTRRGMVAVGVRLLARMARRQRPLRLPQVELFRANQVLLRAPTRVGVTMDGEPSRVTAPVLATVQEGALRVVAPPDSRSGEPETLQPGDGMALPFVPAPDA